MPHPGTAAVGACLALVLLAGDAMAGAKEDVSAAMRRMLALKSYHVAMTHAGQGGMTTEADFVAPDRYRMKMPMGTQTIIGDTMYMLIEGRTMKVPLGKGVITQWRDPLQVRDSEAKMSVSALGRDTVDGRPADKYAVRHADHPDLRMTLWVGGNGLPVQIVSEGKGAGPASGATTLRYSRFNDPALRIDVPK